jgi:lysophospholipase L1-like esterase
MTNILVFGASITWGAWDREGGWVNRLRKFIDEKNIEDSDYYTMVFNLGISGDTTEDVLRRFENEVKEREGAEETIIMFSVGVNDSQFVHDKKDLRVRLEQFEENIKKLIQLSKKHTSKIIFVGFSPIDQAKVDPIPWAKKRSYRKDLVEQFDNKVKEICKEKNIYFIEVYDKVKGGYEKLLVDGVHPNSEGHEKIFQIVKEFLIKNKIIK